MRSVPPAVKKHEEEIKKWEREAEKTFGPPPLPPWLWIVYADGSDNKAEASKHWGKGERVDAGAKK